MLRKTDAAAARRESVAVLMEDRLGVLAEAGVLPCGMESSTRPPTSMKSGLRPVVGRIGLGSPSPSDGSFFVVLEVGGEVHHAVTLHGGGSLEELVSEIKLSFLSSKVSLAETLCRESADFGLGDSWPLFFNEPLLAIYADLGLLDAVSIPICGCR